MRLSVVDLAEQERRELLALVQGLTPQQWEAPSLCAGWRVRDVVAHVVGYDDLGPAEVARLLAGGRGSLHRANALRLEQLSRLPTEELVARVARHQRPAGVTAALGARIALTDGLVHQQDVRRPLGLPRQVPPDRLRAALSFSLAAVPLGALWTARGVRVVATDCDWAFGAGPEARGPGEAVLLALAGRAVAAAELEGPGAAVLQRRLG